jgi:hypothetical protein
MSFLRLRAVMRKEFLQILRDPHTLYIVLAIPVFLALAGEETSG